MFNPTKNEYSFKYLITGITGNGIEKVYLPDPPPQNQILFKKDKKWIRPEMSPELKQWVKEWRHQQGFDPNYVHPHYDKIAEWENQEVERARPGGTGVWFWNAWEEDPTKEPELVYITPFHYWYLTSWKAYFGYPTYRDSDKEIFYWIQYFEEDPDSFGGALNTIRRYGKSSIMGAWITYRATMNYSHNAGMQGEKDDKIKKFYKKMVLKPFYKLPYYFQPKYNTDTKQTNQIEFDLPPQRNKMRSSVEMEEIEVLESMIDYRPSNEEEYDGDILGSFLIEEPGKHKKMSLYNDENEGCWDVAKPCFLDGEKIIGKALLGTTVENMTVNDKGGRAYKKLFYDSDYNQKQEDGRTVSGLYSAFLPGDCAYKGYVDANGRPKRVEARAALMRTRTSYKKNARKLAGWVRKYPLSIKEIFYVSPDRCEFNSEILQDRLAELDAMAEPLTRRVDLYWENNKPFTKALWRSNPTGGWLEVGWLPSKAAEMNLVGKKQVGGETHYYPMNDANFSSGIDPIQHGSTGSSTESRPVQFVKSKYKASIDGDLTREELEERAQPGFMVEGKWVLDPTGKKYPYKTNIYFAMMHNRPSDPNVLYERCLLICWIFGVSINVEKQFGGGLMSWFYEKKCSDFILSKYIAEFEKPSAKPGGLGDDGTAASTSYIQEGTGAYAAYIEYFGHTMLFREQVEDALVFDAKKTTEHDYTVSGYNTEMAIKIPPKVKPKPVLDLDTILPRFDGYGNLMN